MNTLKMRDLGNGASELTIAVHAVQASEMLALLEPYASLRVSVKAPWSGFAWLFPTRITASGRPEVIKRASVEVDAWLQERWAEGW